MYAIPWLTDPKYTRISFWIDDQTVSGGASMTGEEQVIVSPAARWAAAVTLFSSKEDSLSLRALSAQLEGRIGSVLLPPQDGIRPYDAAGRLLSQNQATALDDGSLFFDHSGIGQTPLYEGLVSAAAARGATELTVDLLNGPGPRPGHYFGIGERMYWVRYVWNLTPTRIKVRFVPRLRDAMAGGEPVLLARPVCRMRLAKNDSGRVEYVPGPIITPVVFEFVEAW